MDVFFKFGASGLSASNHLPTFTEDAAYVDKGDLTRR